MFEIVKYGGLLGKAAGVYAKRITAEQFAELKQKSTPEEIVAFLKEKDRNVIRVSYRSKNDADVSVLAASHNGGGHRKAAGCTLYMPIDEAVELIKNEVEKAAE